MRRIDIAVSAVLALGAMVTIAVVIPANTSDGEPGSLAPAFLPYVTASICGAMMLILLFARIVSRREPVEPNPAPKAVSNSKKLAILCAIFLASTAIFHFFGYLVFGLLLVSGLLALMRVNPVGLALVSLLSVASLYSISRYVLGIYLP